MNGIDFNLSMVILTLQTDPLSWLQQKNQLFYFMAVR